MPSSPTHHQHIDPDFSREILEELYAYRRKRKPVAWVLWLTLGWLGAHRFYLEREFTGLAMLFTGGGGMVWWLVDAGFVNRMVERHNQEQERRERAGLPPLGLSFMPALHDDAALERTPPWLEKWQQRGRARRVLRFGGDLLVLLIAGTALGSMAGTEGVPEAIVAVVLLAAITALGAGPEWFDRLPGAHGFVRWSHRLRLFYYHNPPGSPPALLVRAGLGILWAPFSTRARAEVKMLVELGAVFTAIFLLFDLVPGVVVPLVSPTQTLHLTAVARGWAGQAFMTFFATYAFAAPIGAVLNLYLLTRPTHTIPRLLAVFTLVAIFMGVVAM